MNDRIISKKCDCKNDQWEKNADTLSCTNCGFERPYHRRTGHGDGISPSQQRKIDAIRRYFERCWNNSQELHKFEVTPTDYGIVWVSVYTTDFVYTQQGGHFSISRRGAAKVHSVYDLCSSDEQRNERLKWYAEGIGGEVAK